MAATRAINHGYRVIPRLSHPYSPGSQMLFSRGFASKLFVKGISFSSTEKGLAEAFSKFGQVVEAKIVMDKTRTKSKGYGFVTFATEEQARKALDGMNGRLLNGRVIYVGF